MAKIPYGYEVDPTNPRKIIPKTQTAKMGLSGKVPPVPKAGDPIPKGYYLLSDSSLGILPPNMMPLVTGIDASYATVPVRLLLTYDKGYVSEAQYYETTYPTTANIRNANTLGPPPTTYFVNQGKTSIAFLKYGKIADASNGYGFIDDSNLISKTGTFDYTNKNYKDVSNNYDVTFHESPEELQKQNDQYDLSFGEVRVRDQNGNIVIMPYNNVQGNVTYYQPGSFPFGASTYIPKYEDSVYLSRTTQLSTVSPYASSKKPLGACEANANFPDKQEEYCRTLDKNTCSSTSCCVLLGGSKCVAGNEKGPTYKANYGDHLLRNKDSYYYNGKCYGNCV
jgi:hypothetical protein